MEWNRPSDGREARLVFVFGESRFDSEETELMTVMRNTFPPKSFTSMKHFSFDSPKRKRMCLFAFADAWVKS